MTIRLLMTADAVGGIWQYALELAAGLVSRGDHAVDVAVLGPAPSTARRNAAADAGVTLIHAGCAPEWLAADADEVARAGTAIARLAWDRGADLVHLNHPALGVADFHVPVLAALHSCVASWWEAVERGPLPASLAWQSGMVGRGLASADAILCPSASFAATARRLYRLPHLPEVVPNGRGMRAAGAAMRDAAFTSGRLWDRGKNVATLDRAAARLDVPFTAVGATHGPNGDAVALDHLRTPGHVGDDEVAALLSERPVFASAARYEPFGLSVLEAASAGCALVLSDIPTFRELWTDAAIFVAPDDAEGFARAIGALVGDPATRQAMGDRAHARSRDYSAAAMVAATAAIHARLAMRSGGRAAA